MASFKFIMDALEYEIKRQSEILGAGGEMTQRQGFTMKPSGSPCRCGAKRMPRITAIFLILTSWRSNSTKTSSTRSGRRCLELPDQKIHRLVQEFDVPREEVLILTKERAVSDYFTTCALSCDDRKRLSRWIIKDLFKLLNKACLLWSSAQSRRITSPVW